MSLTPDEKFNLRQNLIESGFSPDFAYKFTENPDFSAGPSIHSETADTYYGNLIDKEQLFSFQPQNNEPYSGLNLIKPNVNLNMEIGGLASIKPNTNLYSNVNSGISTITPGNVSFSLPAANNNNSTPESAGNTGGTSKYSYKIVYNGSDGRPTVEYKDASGNSAKVTDLDTDTYNKAQEALKKATEQWEKSKSS